MGYCSLCTAYLVLRSRRSVLAAGLLTTPVVQFDWRRTAAKRIPFDDDPRYRPGHKQRQRRSSLYDVLGVPPKATHGEIKAAYYRLSKTFHPDRNAGSDDAVRRFRDVADAYSVLGSHVTRRRYDKGLLTLDIGGVTHGEQEEDEYARSRHGHGASDGDQEDGMTSTAGAASTSSGRSRSTPAVGNRVGIYNFDEWTKHHYGETLERDICAKQRAATSRQRDESKRKGQRFAELASLLLVVTFTFVYALSFLTANYDTPSTSSSPSSVQRESASRSGKEEEQLEDA